MSDFYFDANNAPDRESFEVLPVGDYKAVIIEAEKKPTKNLTGERINLKIEIIDGEFKGRIVFQGINIANQNPVSQRIGQAELGELCKVLGIGLLKSLDMLKGKPFIAELKVVPASGQYEAKNEVKKYKTIGQIIAQAPAAQAPVQSGSKPSWM